MSDTMQQAAASEEEIASLQSAITTSLRQEAVFFLRSHLRTNKAAKEQLAKLVAQVIGPAIDDLLQGVLANADQNQRNTIEAIKTTLAQALIDKSGGGGDGVPDPPLHP